MLKRLEIKTTASAQHQGCTLNEDRHARTHQAGLDMGVRVALGVLEVWPARHKLIERQQNVIANIRIGIFINGNATGSVRAVDHDRTVGKAFSPDQLLNLTSDIDQLGTWQGVYLCEFDGPRQRSVLVKVVAD